MEVWEMPIIHCDFKKAIDYHTKDLEIAIEVGDRAGEGSAYANLGNAYQSLGDFKKAIEYYSKRLEFVIAAGDRAGEGGIYGNLGCAYRLLGDFRKAIEYHFNHLKIAIEVGNRAGEGSAYANLGIAYNSLGEIRKAVECHSKDLEIAIEVGDLMGVAKAYSNLGASCFNVNDKMAAKEHLEKSIEIMAKLRNSLGSSHALKVPLLELQIGTHRLLQQTLISLESYSRALEVSEQGRTRAFVDQLSSKLSDTPIASVPSIQWSQIQQQSHTCTIVEYTVKTEESYVDEKWNKADVLYIWVVDAGEVHFKKVQLDEIPCLKDSTLEDLVQQARREMDNARGVSFNTTRNVVGNTLSNPITEFENSPDPLLETLSNLYEILIKKIQSYLPTDPMREIIFVPDRCLYLVPFAALYNEGKYLIENHTISIAPSIQIAAMKREHSCNERLKGALLNSNEDKVLLVGNPTMPMVDGKQLLPLHGAETEVTEIAKVLNNVRPLLGDEATKDAVTSRLKTEKTEITLAHFATHGLLKYWDEMQGGLALHGGILTSAEMIQWNLRSLELVVMSACDTGRGEIKADGVIGLARAFLCAGVTSVLVSLWPVGDEKTKLFMMEFYHRMIQGARLQEPLCLASKLREAMIWMIEQDEFGPHYWSAFVLM